MREEILKLLENEYSALDLMTINDKLGLTTVEELQRLEYELDLLVKEYIVYFTNKKKYILLEKCPDFRKGTMQINKSGNGFVVLKDEEDIFVHKNNVGYALDGDEVLVKIFDTKSKSPEGMIIKVLERSLNNIVGLIKSDRAELVFEPNEDRNITLTIDAESLKGCVEGEIVVVSLVDDLGKNRYIGKVTQHICHKDDAQEDILTIAAKYDIFAEFPEDALAQAESIPNEVTEEDRVGREDLTNKMFFTIDGKDTKDIDDAVCLEVKDGYYILSVSIADVSYYVTENSPLDVEALRRGTSSYLADAVIPMLPHKLSNGICSLNPNVDRCSITCEMKIDSRGRVVDSRIFPSIIRSHKKLNYDDVNEVIMNGNIPSGYEKYADNLKQMNELAHIIRAERTRRGASDFGSEEIKIICDENGKAIDIAKRKQADGERLIEDFMVIANETVSETLANMDLPSIYRVHETPKPEKIQSFIDFCSATGHIIKGKFTSMNPKMYQKLLAQINVEGDKKRIYNSLAVRAMPKAKYDVENIGHFGLASRFYSHFTSPIRRYPDLQLHRLLRTYLFEGKLDQRTINYWENNLPSIARQSSDREVAAVEAEREVDKMKMAEYMEQHVGEEYDAIVSGVTGFGLFVQLDNLVEGLIPVTTLDGGNFELMEEMYCLIDKHSKKMYRIGDRLRVKCVGANKASMQIDFEEIRVKDKNIKEDAPVKKELKIGKRK